MMITNDLFEAAKAAQQRAYAPYSDFPVGAAIRTESGAIHSGCNVENAAFPEGWCAETSAISQMVAAGEAKIVEVCVIGGRAKATAPCGGCRQRLAESSSARTKVHAANPNGIKKTFTMEELLPAVFSLEED